MNRDIVITTEDACWISNRIKAHYMAIKKSRKLTIEQKAVIIHKLAERAHRLGFEELCNWLGFSYLKIDLSEGRFAGIFYPTVNKKEAFEGAIHHLEAIRQLKFTEKENPELINKH